MTIEQEAEATIKSLQKQAEAWRKRLADPILVKLIKDNKVHISPLILKLIVAFPPPSTAPE